jgi:hypothetical protein
VASKKTKKLKASKKVQPKKGLSFSWVSQYTAPGTRQG